MLNSLFLSIRQLDDRPIAMVFVKSFAITLLIFVALGGGLVFGAQWLAADWLKLENDMTTLAGAAALLLALLVVWLLFRITAIAVVGIFADEVVEAVEAKYYPDIADKARPVSFGRSLGISIGSVVRTIIVNILLIPFYLGLLLTGIGSAVLFFLVNSWLLGRDLGDMVAARHHGKQGLKRWRRGTFMMRLVLGGVTAGLLVVPIINLVAPVIAAAMATHLYYRKQRKTEK